MQQFAEQLARCAQSNEEATAFMEAFARVRLAGITKALAAPLAQTAAAEGSVEADWTDTVQLAESGITATALEGLAEPGKHYLHIEVAIGRNKVASSTFLAMTGLSDKQKADLFPLLSTARGGPNRSALAAEVQRLNRHLDWIRSTGVSPEMFLTYHRHLAIHGASQNAAGTVGAMGAVIAFVDALTEIAPDSIVGMVGQSPTLLNDRSPEAIAEYLTSGTLQEREAKRVRALALRNGRFVVFANDPDVSIFVPLSPLKTRLTASPTGRPRARTIELTAAQAALRLYNEVRQHTDLRSQHLHEFAVGEVKTATDPSNLHERLALGSRETKVEVNADRFLMMALLTKDLLEGGSGKRSGRAPLQNRDTVRFSDVFNLHFAWGWDSSRRKHSEHWASFKSRLKVWAGI